MDTYAKKKRKENVIWTGCPAIWGSSVVASRLTKKKNTNSLRSPSIHLHATVREDRLYSSLPDFQGIECQATIHCL